ncbi:MAG: insulinase family protein, partial [Desulfobacterales bacterium]|nr:insulinase family protein [Desulfobacterales bacterium]
TSYQALLARITAKELKPFTQGKILTALMEKKPEGGAITSSKELPIISGKEYILSNGVKLIVRPSKSSPGEFTMKALSSGGRSNTEDKDYKRVSLAPAMVAQSGFVGIPQTELKRLMAGRKVGVSAGIDATVASLTGGATIDETEALFQLLNLYFTKPNVTKKALTIQKTRLSQAIKAKKNDKKFVFHARANKEKYNEKFRDTPWTMEDLKTLNVPDLLADFKHFFHSPADFTFTFVGDVNPDEIAKLAATYLGGLPGTPGKATVRDRGLRLRKVTGDQNIRITGTGDLVDRTSVDFTWQADSTFDLTRSARMGLLKRILNRRLRETIREEEGGVYSIGSSLRIQSVPVPLFRGGMGFTCDPERVEELIPKAEKIVHDMGKNGVTEKEVKTAIKQTLTSLKLAKKKNRFWVNSIAICMVRNWPLDQLVNRDQVIANTTTEQVSALAKEHLSGIRGFITIYGPEAGVKSLSDN